MYKLVKRVGTATAALALTLSASAAFADGRPTGEAALVLAHTLASAAARAEQGATPQSAVGPAVTAAAQNVIITAGADPRLVLLALDDTLIGCRPVTGRPAPTWSCPGSAAAFDALQSLRAIVVAQLDQAGVAAIDTRGFAAFGSVPVTSPGGAGYITP